MAPIPSSWRVSYAPGEWIVLSGPTSLVILQPFAEEWSSLVNALWEEVLASSSLPELAERLAGHGLEEMPSFGAFFWTADGMRSLLRGAVTATDVATGRVVADGRGVQTWSEIGLADLAGIRIELPTADEGGGMELPLVVGAVRASLVTLDARLGQGPSSPQGASGESSREVAADDDGAPTEAEGPPFELAARGPGPAVGTMASGLVENAETELLVAPSALVPVPDAATGTARTEREPLLAPDLQVPGITLSDGRSVSLVTAVRIGRAPTADQQQSLLVVSSPNQDVSRTHLEIGLRDGEVVAIDLHSTNGTLLERPGSAGPPETLEPGATVLVPIGSRLDLGDGVSVVIEPPAGRPA